MIRGTRVLITLGITVLALVFVAACSGDTGPYELEQQVTMSIQLTTPTMPERDVIPTRHTCEAEDLSPPLEWSGLPAGTASIAIVAIDVDADEGEFTHWTAWNIPADATGVDEAALPAGMVQGQNDFESVGYRGPCPPPRFVPQGEAPVRVDPSHRYVFTVYALDTRVDLASGASKDDLLKAIDGHILAGAEGDRRFQATRIITGAEAPQ